MCVFLNSTIRVKPSEKYESNWIISPSSSKNTKKWNPPGISLRLNHAIKFLAFGFYIALTKSGLKWLEANQHSLNSWRRILDVSFRQNHGGSVRFMVQVHPAELTGTQAPNVGQGNKKTSHVAWKSVIFTDVTWWVCRHQLLNHLSVSSIHRTSLMRRGNHSETWAKKIECRRGTLRLLRTWANKLSWGWMSQEVSKWWGSVGHKS